jgi:hypothetical protein
MSVFVTGRSVANYLAKGDTVEPECVVVDCWFCEQPVVLSQVGGARLVATRERGELAGAVCTPCALILAAQEPGLSEVHLTPNGERISDENKGSARELIDELMKGLKR